MSIPRFQVTYQTPKMASPAVDRGLTREGVRALQLAIFRAGGWGVCVDMPQQSTALERLIAKGFASPPHPITRTALKGPISCRGCRGWCR